MWSGTSQAEGVPRMLVEATERWARSLPDGTAYSCCFLTWLRVPIAIRNILILYSHIHQSFIAFRFGVTEDLSLFPGCTSIRPFSSGTYMVSFFMFRSLILCTLLSCVA